MTLHVRNTLSGLMISLKAFGIVVVPLSSRQAPVVEMLRIRQSTLRSPTEIVPDLKVRKRGARRLFMPRRFPQKRKNCISAMPRALMHIRVQCGGRRIAPPAHPPHGLADAALIPVFLRTRRLRRPYGTVIVKVSITTRFCHPKAARTAKLSVPWKLGYGVYLI